ncbi:hypothetical protein IWW39_000545 [Coemansia spiralis]|uniref:Uncharacterized protein n=1 Tax=Coemansia spiralis TaxID=417178 RepID=A0A9W8GP94_9FUNG|nr:hypothetical protein IWW39_000545 [Coemansia spiralis]
MADIPYETPVAADEPSTSGPNLCEHTCNGESAPVNASNMCQNHQVEEPSKIVGDAEGTKSTEENVNDTKHIEGAAEGTVENVAEVAPEVTPEVAPEGAPEDANEGPASGPTEDTQ